MIDTLVISIGGIKGISFIGVLDELFKKISIDDIKFIIGSSVGSIIGILLSIGYKPDEIYSICTEIDFAKFTLNPVDQLHECINDEICNLDNLNNFGLDNCNGLIRLLKSIIQIKCSPNITFKEHYEKYNKELTIVATNIDELKSEYFNYKSNPNDKIIDIVKLSISIPIIYIMQNHNNINYTDGGISDYYPIEFYNKETSIGICLIKTNNNIKKNNENFINYLYNIVNSLEIYMNSLLRKLYNKYTIFIDTNIISLNKKHPGDFNIKSEHKEKLYKLGKELFIKYYEKNTDRFIKNTDKL